MSLADLLTAGVSALRQRVRHLRLTWHHVADIGDLAEQTVIGRTVGDRQIALYRVKGAYHATSGWCTHAHVLLCLGEIVDGLIECPAHFGYFDIATGKAQGAPVTRHLDVFPVRIDGTRLLVGLK